MFKEIADKVYAHEFSKENRKINTENLNFPFSRSGDKVAFEEAAKYMNIPVNDQTKNLTQWVSTRTGSESIKIVNKKIIKGLVPNVIGMGLIDAAYLLEQHGLFVQPVGSGIVRDQSIIPGGKIIKGQKIILKLG